MLATSNLLVLLRAYARTSLGLAVGDRREPLRREVCRTNRGRAFTFSDGIEERSLLGISSIDCGNAFMPSEHAMSLVVLD
ncbi:hypothetical protein [Mesorhizobium sp. NZP2077]|uniref:hypothetical protein n=1 Tax=Mesorhizobium sp. NZP2077 TaxID=2483404 RepID=UPI0015525974|nr:hypothetical protein [Mesorhizobium sp. NZP2077]QKD15703.1 hypothetical protein HGP13_11680 [Mesorhizobium sp. NZP2077]